MKVKAKVLVRLRKRSPFLCMRIFQTAPVQTVSCLRGIPMQLALQRTSVATAASDTQQRDRRLPFFAHRFPFVSSYLSQCATTVAIFQANLACAGTKLAEGEPPYLGPPTRWPRP